MAHGGLEGKERGDYQPKRSVAELERHEVGEHLRAGCGEVSVVGRSSGEEQACEAESDGFVAEQGVAVCDGKQG